MVGDGTPFWPKKKQELEERLLEKGSHRPADQLLLGDHGLRELPLQDQCAFRACNRALGDGDLREAKLCLYSQDIQAVQEGTAILRTAKTNGVLTEDGHWLATKVAQLPKKHTKKNVENYIHGMLAVTPEGEAHPATRGFVPEVAKALMASFPHAPDVVDPVDASMFNALLFADMARGEITETLCQLREMARCSGTLQGTMVRVLERPGNE